MNKLLDFSDIIQNFQNYFIKNGWITVYDTTVNSSDDRGATYCCFINSKQYLESALKSDNWDLSFGHNGPTIITSYNGKSKRTKYYSKSNKAIDHFVICRHDFPNGDEYIEISEEFRLYYNLLEKKSKDILTYIYFNKNGDEEEIIRIISGKKVEVQFRAVMDYISTKKIYFAIQFDYMRFSDKTISELGLEEKDIITSDYNYCYSYLLRNDISFQYKTQAWIMGKYIIYPKKNHKIKDWFPLDEEDKYADFIYDFDENGNTLSFTCDKEKLANYFGKNPNNPLYTTPIYFRKEVLQKYFHNPQKYSVEDGLIRCGSSWVLRIDNNCKDYVSVFLGDLGMLTYKEQLYWKSYNIEKQKGISYTTYSRAFLGEPANPDSPDLYFKMRYSDFCIKTKEKNGESFFKPLTGADIHYFETLHTLLEDNNAKDFDEQILSLTKVLIDSLNEKYLVQKIKIPLEENDKGIDKLEKYLKSNNSNIPVMITFFRNLQNLRSTTVAHRRSESNKHKKEAEKYFQIGVRSYKEILQDIFVKAIYTINSLAKIENIILIE